MIISRDGLKKRSLTRFHILHDKNLKETKNGGTNARIIKVIENKALAD